MLCQQPPTESLLDTDTDTEGVTFLFVVPIRE